MSKPMFSSSTLRIATGVILLAMSLPAALAQGSESDVARRAVHVCASCHGENGVSPTPLIPNLAGQSAPYVARQLKDFRSQQRSETDSQAYMWGISALLDDATITALADHYAGLAPAPGHPTGTAAQRKLGQQIFEKGIPDRGVRACASCHGGKGEGASAFPRLAGQHAAYLERQLRTFGTRLRPHGVLMKAEVADMKPAELKAVAAYLQSL